MEEAEATLMMATTIEKKQEATTSWKLYDNPHFSSISDHHHHHRRHPYYYYNKKSVLLTKSQSRSSLHSRNFSDFFRAMDREPNLSDLDNAIALIKELRTELDFERRMRKKTDLLNKTLAREAEEETRRRKAAEEEIACVREDSERRMREAEEERRMMRTAEAWREERLQMKLAEARLAIEDKYYLLNKQETETTASTDVCVKKTKVEEKKKENIIKVDDCCSQMRKDIENPHIKRGIKGGLEFPKAVRVRGSGGNGSSPNSTHSQGQRGGGLGSNLECQRAQLRVLLRHHRNPDASVIIGPPHNLVM